MEGYHGALKVMCEGLSLQFWPLIKVLIEQQAMSNLDIARHLSGQQRLSRKKKYVNIEYFE